MLKSVVCIRMSEKRASTGRPSETNWDGGEHTPLRCEEAARDARILVKAEHPHGNCTDKNEHQPRQKFDAPQAVLSFFEVQREAINRAFQIL